mgnify:CR=1 FL=1
MSLAPRSPRHHTYCKCAGNFTKCCDNPANYPSKPTTPPEVDDDECEFSDYESGIGRKYEYMEERSDCSDTDSEGGEGEGGVGAPLPRVSDNEKKIIENLASAYFWSDANWAQ